MAVDFMQIVTAAAQQNAQCSGNSNNTEKMSRLARFGGTAAGADTLTVDGSAADLNGVWVELDDLSSYVDATGNWTWRLNVTSGNHQLTLDEVHICHVDSSYVAKTTIGGSTGLGINLSSTGVKSGTINQGSLLTNFASTDKIIVIYGFDNGNSMGQDGGFTFDQNINAPGTWTSPPVITDVETDEDVTDGDTAVTVTGTDFEATQGTGKVEIGDDSVYASATLVNQNIESWSATAVDITVSLSTTLKASGALYVFLTNDSGDRSDGFQITVHRKQMVSFSLSPNLTGGGATTNRLTLHPSTTFFAGDIVEQATDSPHGPLNMTTDTSMELLASLELTPDADLTFGNMRFRLVEDGGALLDTYTLYPTVDEILADQLVPEMDEQTREVKRDVLIPVDPVGQL